MKRNIHLIVFVLLLIIPTRAYANCTYSNISELKNIADNVNYDYNYFDYNQGVKFQIRFSNLNSKVYIYDTLNKKSYYNTENQEIVLANLNPGYQYKFEIRAYNSNPGNQIVTIKVIENGVWIDKTYVTGLTNNDCIDIIKTVYVNIPYYNKFYLDKSCEGLEKYSICQKWSRNDINYEQFKSEIAKIINSNRDEIVEKKDNKIDFPQSILNFIGNYYYIVIIIAIIVITGIILLIKRREKGFEGW